MMLLTPTHTQISMKQNGAVVERGGSRDTHFGDILRRSLSPLAEGRACSQITSKSVFKVKIQGKMEIFKWRFGRQIDTLKLGFRSGGRVHPKRITGYSSVLPEIPCLLSVEGSLGFLGCPFYQELLVMTCISRVHSTAPRLLCVYPGTYSPTEAPVIPVMPTTSDPEVRDLVPETSSPDLGQI